MVFSFFLKFEEKYLYKKRLYVFEYEMSSDMVELKLIKFVGVNRFLFGEEVS